MYILYTLRVHFVNLRTTIQLNRDVVKMHIVALMYHLEFIVMYTITLMSYRRVKFNYCK